MTDEARQHLNKKNTFLNKYFNLIIFIIFIAIFILSYVFLLGPKLKSAQTAIKENLNNQNLLYQQQKRKLMTLESIINVYGQIPASDLSRFNAVLPYKYNKEQLFGELEEIVVKNGWILENVTLTYPDEEIEVSSRTKVVENTIYGSSNPKVKRVEVELSVQGVDYFGVKKLLGALEKNIRLFDVNEISFSGDSQVQIMLTTYYYEN